jgi:hypothetical protein
MGPGGSKTTVLACGAVWAMAWIRPAGLCNFSLGSEFFWLSSNDSIGFKNSYKNELKSEKCETNFVE